ncbi:MAG: isochorismatase family cysteine hydrolase [Phoenicibacter congonensis]|uniref:Isochorismatase family cysteine hydrolase n=1 Tax=Phoenicibacter congonensis TaxID=1944646 RepID=A0AA43RH24_9ACTN|nr:isochorismatase family cysteine hydrolase [Phoenicibacter congonensis]
MKALIVVDMQNDFVTDSLGSPDAQKIVPNVVQKVKDCLAAGDKVFFTRDTHTPAYLSTLEGKNLPVEHCIEGTHGWEIIDELKPFVDQSAGVIDKPTFGSYKLVDTLEPLIANDEVREIELCGLCTDICVVSNALLLRAKFYETTITVDSSCCAGVTPDSHESALNTMRSCQINVL